MNVRIRLVMVLLVGVAGAAAGAPSADLWPRWQAHAGGSTATIDHRAFDRFLAKYVVMHDHGPNGVRYRKVSAADEKSLMRYINRLERVAIDGYSRPVQRAYWINLYNAETLRRVLKNYPVDSIRDIGGFLSFGPWNDKTLVVEGQKLSLNDIEHRILRPIWHDSLTHFGVNCASIGCPSLLAEAYTGATVDQKLRANRRAYINSPQGVQVQNGRVTVSKIFDWYAPDFGADDAAVVAYLRRFARPPLAAKLKGRQQIDATVYDWSLNSETAVAKRPTIDDR